MIGKIPEELKVLMKDPDYMKKLDELWLKAEAKHFKESGRNTKR